jgi:hypothetical protein
MSQPDLEAQLAKLVQAEAEQVDDLRLPDTTVSVDGTSIKLSKGDRVFIAERLGKDSCLVSTEEPAAPNGFQTRVPTNLRVNLNRAAMHARAKQWPLIRA